MSRSIFADLGKIVALSFCGLLSCHAQSNKPNFVPKNLRTLLGHQREARSVVFSPNGKFIASAGGDTAVILWDAKSGRKLKKFEATEAEMLSVPLAAFSPAVSFSADSKFLAVGEAKTAFIYDISKRQVLKVLVTLPATNRMGAWNLRFSSDGKYLWMIGTNGAVEVWDTKSWKKLHSALPAGSVVFPPVGSFCAITDSKFSIVLWDAFKSRNIRTINRGYQSMAQKSLGPIIAIAPSGSMVAFSSDNHTVRLCNTSTGKHLRALTVPPYVVALALSPDGKTLATASVHSQVKLWDVKTGKEKFGFRVEAGGINLSVGANTALTFSPDGHQIATANHNGTLKIWDVE